MDNTITEVAQLPVVDLHERTHVDGQGAIERLAAERAARELPLAPAAEVEDDRLRDTPRRMADAHAELLTAERLALTPLAIEVCDDGLVVARDIPLHSLCMHRARAVT